MVVLDQLALLVAVILGDQTLAAEEQPLDEAIERLALVGRGLDGATQFGLMEDTAGRRRSGTFPAQLLEGLIETVLAAVGPACAGESG